MGGRSSHLQMTDYFSLHQWKQANSSPAEAVKVWCWGLLQETIHPKEFPKGESHRRGSMAGWRTVRGLRYRMSFLAQDKLQASLGGCWKLKCVGDLGCECKKPMQKLLFGKIGDLGLPEYSKYCAKFLPEVWDIVRWKRAVGGGRIEIALTKHRRKELWFCCGS